MTEKLLRLPKPNTRCPYTGLSRGTLYRWITPTEENAFTPPVKSYLVKRSPKAKKGIRWIDLDSLMAYIKGQKQPATGKQEDLYRV